MTKRKDCHDFEKLYMRWKYFQRSRAKLKDEAQISYYLNLFKTEITSTSYSYFYSNRLIFRKVGMGLEDLESIAKIHLVSFMGLFSLTLNEDKRTKHIEKIFAQNGTVPTSEMILKKDRVNYISFLRQRFFELLQYSIRKLQKISIHAIKRKYFKAITMNQEVNGDKILINYQQYGYTPISAIEFRTIRTNSGNGNQKSFYFDGYHYFSATNTIQRVTKQDYNDLGYYNTEDCEHTQSPEEILIKREELTSTKK